MCAEREGCQGVRGQMNATEHPWLLPSLLNGQGAVRLLVLGVHPVSVLGFVTPTWGCPSICRQGT